MQSGGPVSRTRGAIGLQRPLGRRLCVKRPSRALGVFGIVLAGVFLVTAVAVGLDGQLALGAFGLVVSLLFAWIALWTLTKRWEIHEEGIATASMFGTDRLHFDDLATFATGNTQLEHETMVSLRLIRRHGKPLKINCREKDFDDDLKALRKRLTTRVMAAMEETLRRDGHVEWLAAGSGARSSPAVSIDWSGLIVRARPELRLPWEQVNISVGDGSFVLRQGQKGRVLVTCPVLAPNYRPGIALIDSILERGGPAARDSR